MLIVACFRCFLICCFGRLWVLCVWDCCVCFGLFIVVVPWVFTVSGYIVFGMPVFVCFGVLLDWFVGVWGFGWVCV